MVIIVSFILLLATFSACPCIALSASVESSHAIQFVGSVQHDTSCLTEGFVFHDGKLFESCGEKMGLLSRIRMIDPMTGYVMLEKVLPQGCSAEGLTAHDNYLYLSTRFRMVLFILDAHTLELVGERSFLTHIGEVG
jgi:glutamine cyclotransferase